MKVAIWGSYNYGNYGDDVMAIMFAKHLQKLGVRVCVYRLNRELARRYAIETSESLEELLQGASFCLAGGGTVLLEPLSGTVGQAMNEDTRQLWEITQAHRCPLYLISVGGNGMGGERKLTLYQWRILSSEMCRGGTVRLSEDVALFELLGKEVELYPDVVLALTDWWPVEKKSWPSPQLQIGLCLPNIPNVQRFVSLLKIVAHLRRHAVFHFMRTHLPGYNIKDEILPPANSPWFKHHYYEDPATTIQFIASLDLLISVKLHPSITALALGVPVCSLDGRAKTRAVLNSLELGFATRSQRTRSLLTLLRQVSSRKGILQIREQFDFQRIEQQKELSRRHFEYLTRLTESFREGKLL